MRKKLAVIMGGYSSEYQVSVKSGQNIFDSIDKNRYEAFRIELSQNGIEAWDENGNEISFEWREMSIRKKSKFIKIELIFNLVHGHPGENGNLAMHWENLAIPYTSSAPGPSALTFHKAWTNGVVSRMGVRVPKAILVQISEDYDNLISKVESFTFPIFIKPSRSGSSFGISKVKSFNNLETAIKIASKEDKSIVIEECVSGVEVACGLFRFDNQIKITGITEIIYENEFFDFEAKYNGRTKEITPANISESSTRKIEEISQNLYSKLELKGFCRLDFIVQNNDSPILIEINTIPGMTKESIIPKQLKALGLSLKDFTNLIAAETINNGKNRNFPGIF